MSEFLETIKMYFSFSFVQYAFIAGIMIAIVSSLLGVTLVLKKFSYIGDGLSHTAFGAMAMASVLKIFHSIIFVLPVTVFFAILILCTIENEKTMILFTFVLILASRCNKKNDFTSVDQNKVQKNLPETESVNSIENQETEEKKSVPIIPSNPYKDVPKKIDLDFTKMNYNMASSVIFEMLIEPEKYLNKTVKIDGQFETSVYEGNRYFAVINWDLTGCCPSGLNFIPPDSMIYPYDFPEAGAFVTVTGAMKEAFNGKSNELYFFMEDCS